MKKIHRLIEVFRLIDLKTQAETPENAAKGKHQKLWDGR